MRFLNNKTTLFLTGVLTGIIIGIVITLLLVNICVTNDEKDKEQIISQPVKQSDIEHLKSDAKITSETKKSQNNKKRRDKQDKPDQASKTEQNIDSLNLINSDTSLKNDSLVIPGNRPSYRSELADTVTNLIDTNDDAFLEKDTDYIRKIEEEIVVIRDELVSTRSTTIEGLINKSQEYDSLLDPDMEKKTTKNNVYRIEIWSSPVNYKGYKLAKNKIILYGINPYDSLTFLSSNDSIFLKHINKLYLLEIDENFRQLIPLKKD